VSVRFRYRASTGTGEIVDGVVEVVSEQGLLEQLRRRDLYPVEIRELAPTSRKRRRQLGRRPAVTRWARNVGALLGAATTVDRALAITAEQAGHDGLAQTLAAVREAVRGGEDLSAALARYPSYFPAIAPAMVRAGEASGTLDTVFEQLADFMEETDELRSQVQSALLYPALMAVVASLGITVLLLFVVPRFAGILEDVGGTLPLTTRSMIWLGDAISRFWWAIGLVLAGAVALGIERYRRPEAQRAWHANRLRLPLLGDLEHKLLTARFTRTLGLLLRNGTSLVPALRIARASVTNIELAAALERATGIVAEGGSLAHATKDALPPLAVQMLAVGEESGRLEDMCLRVAHTFEGEVRRSVKTAVALIEPVMIVVFGVLVGFVALAMLQAIYSINTSVF
jgi:type II secretory pathway component PulF